MGEKEYTNLYRKFYGLRGECMAITVKMNGINQVPKGETLFEEGMPSDSVFVVLKGKAVLTSGCVYLTAAAGDFIGLWDVASGFRAMTCTATEELSVYAFPVKRLADMQAVLKANKEYGGRAVASLGNYIAELKDTLQEYVNEAKQLPEKIKELYQGYCDGCRAEEARAELLPEEANESFEEPDFQELMAYYDELHKVPAELVKNYFSYGTIAAMRHLTEQISLAQILLQECEIQADFIRRQGSVLINGGSDNLFFWLCTMEEMAKELETKKNAVLLRERLERKLYELEKLFARHSGVPFASQEKRREARLLGQEVIVSGDDPCEHSLAQILSYSGVTEEEAEAYKALVKSFDLMEDKSSTEDEDRKLRKKLAEGFYKIYEACFRKAYKKEEKTIPLPVRLFLDFGFMDETLVSRSQMLELEKLTLLPVRKEAGGCHVFTVREWLTWVYEGKREPSKNEFDQEYSEMLRDLKKGGQITEEEEKALFKNYDERLHYEVQNLFRYNHRLVNGQLSIFVPFLHREMLSGGIEKSFAAKQKVEKALERLRELDFSLFYREFLYVNKELGIEKEYRVAEVLPDVILFPTMGSKSLLWQDISCRRRDTPGRFLLPILAEVSLDDLLLQICGRYRWELCRTVQGAAWNNIQVKSLTSEYTDYLMYYKKNRDISEERKEKVKAQLQKAKNNYREVFAADYVVWMKNESTGAMKLNKVAREILATYVPFDKSIREQLVQQPAFEDAMARHRRERAKKIRETELRNHALTKNGIELPKELVDTMEYYRNH